LYPTEKKQSAWPSKSLALSLNCREIMLFIGNPRGRSIMISNKQDCLGESFNVTNGMAVAWVEIA